MTITKMLKAWLKENDWPTSPTRIGPGSCGQSNCRAQHAYVEAVGRPSMLTDEVVYAFIFDRPCNYHESNWDAPYRQRLGLSAKP